MFREFLGLGSLRGTGICIADQREPAVAHVILREAGQDTAITIPNPVGETGSKTIPILKGTKVNAISLRTACHLRFPGALD